jgi:hypothetical protein
MPNSIQHYTFAQLEALWIQAGGDRASAPVMAAIALAESSGNPAAINDKNSDGSVDRGLWQINSSNVNSVSMFNPTENAKEAVKIKNSQGLKAWVTYTSGEYRKFLGSAAPDNNLPSGSTSTATPADSLTGDIGSAIGQGLGQAFQALFQPLISTLIWGGEILFGIGIMVAGLAIFVINTGPGKSAIASGSRLAEDGIGVAAPEVTPEIEMEQRVRREQARLQREKQVRQEARRRNKSPEESS